MTAWTREKLSERFRRFGEVECKGDSALYERFSLGIADDDELLLLASHAQSSQPPPNMIFAAAHYLLLGGIDHPLAAHYPTVTGGASTPNGDPFPLFREFCLEYRDEMAALIASRRVQTNEVRRSAALFPAFGIVSKLAGGQPLSLIDIGTSAGLNLLWDRYGVRYSNGQRAGDAASPVQIECEVRGKNPIPLPDTIPVVSSRMGIDINPIDLGDDEALRWLKALIWPEHTERMATANNAIEIARQNLPPIRQGDALNLLPEVLDALPDDAIPCVFHTFAIYQLTPEMRDHLNALIAEQTRRFQQAFRIGLEGMNLVTHAPELELSQYRDGQLHSSTLLAQCTGHVRWIRWLA